MTPPPPKSFQGRFPLDFSEIRALSPKFVSPRLDFPTFQMRRNAVMPQITTMIPLSLLFGISFLCFAILLTLWGAIFLSFPRILGDRCREKVLASFRELLVFAKTRKEKGDEGGNSKSNPLVIWNRGDSNLCDVSCDFYHHPLQI